MARVLGPGEGDSVEFGGLAPLLPPNRSEPDFEALAEVRGRYDLEMDPESIGPLVERHGLRA